MEFPRIAELGSNKQLLYLLSREHITSEDCQTIQRIRRSSPDHFFGNLMGRWLANRLDLQNLQSCPS